MSPKTAQFPSQETQSPVLLLRRFYSSPLSLHLQCYTISLATPSLCYPISDVTPSPLLPHLSIIPSSFYHIFDVTSPPMSLHLRRSNPITNITPFSTLPVLRYYTNSVFTPAPLLPQVRIAFNFEHFRVLSVVKEGKDIKRVELQASM